MSARRALFGPKKFSKFDADDDEMSMLQGAASQPLPTLDVDTPGPGPASRSRVQDPWRRKGWISFKDIQKSWPLEGGAYWTSGLRTLDPWTLDRSRIQGPGSGVQIQSPGSNVQGPDSKLQIPERKEARSCKTGSDTL